MVKLKGREDYPFYFGATPEIMRRAAELRKNMTESEKLLWGKLRNKQLEGIRFRRQHPIKTFIVDFFSHDYMLAIEVDGAVHQESSQHERDIERARILKSLGISEVRFSNEEVMYQMDVVLSKIKQAINKNN